MKYLTKKSSLEKFMTKKPFLVNENMPASKALAIMNEKKITSLLVVSDKDFKKKIILNLKELYIFIFFLKREVR